MRPHLVAKSSITSMLYNKQNQGKPGTCQEGIKTRHSETAPLKMRTDVKKVAGALKTDSPQSGAYP